MKAIKLLVVFGVGLAIGLAGGGVFGFSYGKKSAQADIDFQKTPATPPWSTWMT